MLKKIVIKSRISLKEIRILTGKTQKEFATYVEIPYRTYRRKEQGSKMNASELSRISVITGVPMDKIIF